MSWFFFLMFLLMGVYAAAVTVLLFFVLLERNVWHQRYLDIAYPEEVPADHPDETRSHQEIR